jgi:cyclase
LLKTRIIPCLDVDNGRVVKGINFVSLKDAGDPVEQATIYSKEGADEITFLDITATHQERRPMIDVIKKTAEKCFVPLTVGGGIRNISGITDFLNAGADKVSINSAAIKNPNLIKEGSKKFGNQCIVVAIDAKKKSNGWNVFINGGRIDTGMDVVEWAKKAEGLGAGEILLTSMDKDGTKSGFDIELTSKVSNCLNIPVIASGGVGSLDHFLKGISLGGASAVLAASVFHFKEITIKEVKNYLISNGVKVRLDNFFNNYD